MFYDERIELARGKISRDCIALCVLLSFISGFLQIHNLFRYTDRPALWIYVGLEAIIVLTGLIILTLGLCRGRGSDERATMSRNLFYNKAMFVFLVIVGTALAILFPISLTVRRPANFTSYEFGSIVELLLLVVGIYAVFSFKKQDISFNYSFMDSPHYYRNVWKNIGKALLYILCAFGLSLATMGVLWALELRGSANAFNSANWLLLYAWYAILPLICMGLYLLFSFLERESYQNETRLSKAAGISLVAAVAVYCVYAYALLQINGQLIDSEYKLRLLKLAQKLFPYAAFTLMMFLIYFTFEYDRLYGKSLAGTGCRCILLGVIGTECLRRCLTQVQYILITADTQNTQWLPTMSYLQQASNDLAILSYIAGFCLIVTALIKDRMLPKLHYALYAVFAVLTGVDLFLRSQSNYMQRTVFLAAVYAAVLIYLCAVVCHVIGKSCQREDSQHE